jgi:hypothetical protein
MNVLKKSWDHDERGYGGSKEQRKNISNIKNHYIIG